MNDNYDKLVKIIYDYKDKFEYFFLNPNKSIDEILDSLLFHSFFQIEIKKAYIKKLEDENKKYRNSIAELTSDINHLYLEKERHLKIIIDNNLEELLI
jgi:uncharacterized FlaG/YvyC family protein